MRFRFHLPTSSWRLRRPDNRKASAGSEATAERVAVASAPQQYRDPRPSVSEESKRVFLSTDSHEL